MCLLGCKREPAGETPSDARDRKPLYCAVTEVSNSAQCSLQLPLLAGLFAAAQELLAGGARGPRRWLLVGALFHHHKSPPVGPQALSRQECVLHAVADHFLQGQIIQSLFFHRAQEERAHYDRAEKIEKDQIAGGEMEREEHAKRRLFVLQIVQPGLVGLMDGSVSTLAPIFAAAVATRNSWDAFLVGLAASVGAGISMGFAEALSDDGSLTGRGHPWLRGVVCGAMTALGGIGHTLPFLIPRFTVAMTVAIVVVVCELGIITWVRHRFMDSPAFSAAVQIILGGVLVFLTGILIGSS